MGLEEDSLNHLGFEHIATSYKKAIKIIEDRKDGLVLPYKTCWTKFNGYINGGLEPSEMIVIAARPGVGKSAFVNRLIFSVFKENPFQKVIVLYYNFEMKSSMQVIREVSFRTNLSVGDLLSSSNRLSESYFENVKSLKTELSGYPIFYRDIPCTVNYSAMSTLDVVKKFPEHHIIRIFDHTRLFRKEKEADELARLNDLAASCMYIEKETGCTDILISQLNRSIESPERAASMYVPQLSDLFGADSIGQAAHKVIILQRPEMYSLKSYLNKESSENLLAVHIVKNRNGDVLWLPFDHDLKINKIIEREAA